MIAIIDDYKAVREALEKLLRSLGYCTSTVGSAENFLKSETLPDTSCSHHWCADARLDRYWLARSSHRRGTSHSHHFYHGSSWRER